MSVEEALETGRMLLGVDLEIDTFRKDTIKMIQLGKRLGMSSEFIYMAYLNLVKTVGVAYSRVCALRLMDSLSSLCRAYMRIEQDITSDEQHERFTGWCKQVIYTVHMRERKGDNWADALIKDGDKVLEEIYGAERTIEASSIVENIAW